MAFACSTCKPCITIMFTRFFCDMQARQIQQQGKASSGDGDGKKVGNNKKRRRDNDVEMAEAEVR